MVLCLGDGPGGGEGGGVAGGGAGIAAAAWTALNDNEVISMAWEYLLLWRGSMLGRAFEQERARKKKGRGGEGFQEVQVTYNIKIHSTYAIKD